MTETDRFSRYARIALVAAALVAAGSIGYRLKVDGAKPQASAPAETQAGAGESIAELEARTKGNPEDADGWQALGWAYSGAERYADAAGAYRRATQLQPQNAELWSSLGEALLLSSEQEAMPAEALAAFRKANELDKNDPRARYFLAVARDLGGDHAGAIDDLLGLLADTPAGAPWEANLRRTIERIGEGNGIETASRLAAVKQPAPVAQPGPTREQVEAAASMTPEQQRQMAEDMIGRLEARLQSEPGRIDGWLLLIRSRMSLGQPDKAKAALASAIKANPGAADEIRAQARAMGVD